MGGARDPRPSLVQSDGMIALSAIVAGVALAGAVAAARSAGSPWARLYLMMTFALFLGIASVPLVIAFARPLYVFHMPAVLPMVLALPAVIHLYAKARTRGEDMALVTRRDVILPAAGLITTLGYWSLAGDAKRAMFVDGELPPGILPSALALVTFGLILLWCLSSLAYLIATIRELRAHRQRLKALYSNTEQYELRWIDGLLAMLVALWAAAAVFLMADNFGPGLLFPEELVFALAAAVLFFLMAYALAPEPHPQDEPDAPADAASETLPEDKYARSALSSERAEQIAERIEAAMRVDHVYLEANLSLQKLSSRVGAPQNLVSQTLNERLGTTFFDYVARWRVDAAKPLIRAGEKSVLMIALDVGFNSRSTFYKAFKRETGLTPKAFRDSQQASGA